MRVHRFSLFPYILSIEISFSLNGMPSSVNGMKKSEFQSQVSTVFDLFMEVERILMVPENRPKRFAKRHENSVLTLKIVKCSK